MNIVSTEGALPPTQPLPFLLAIIWDMVPCSPVHVSGQPAPSIIMINAPNRMTEAAGSCVMSVHISQSITLKNLLIFFVIKVKQSLYRPG